VVALLVDFLNLFLFYFIEKADNSVSRFRGKVGRV
jgi:hypothetical protein